MSTEKIIFALWIAAPILFLLFALWATLERSAKNKSTHPSEYLKHALFLSACGGVAFLIHLYVLDALIPFIPVSLPRNLYLLLIWPMVLFFAATAIGPSRDIMISKAPNLWRKKR